MKYFLDKDGSTHSNDPYAYVSNNRAYLIQI